MRKPKIKKTNWLTGISFLSVEKDNQKERKRKRVLSEGENRMKDLCELSVQALFFFFGFILIPIPNTE